MLIRSDIVPGDWGAFRIRGQTELVDAGRALTAIVRGEDVTPADEPTVLRLAAELEQRGNATRAAMLRRVANMAAPVAVAEPAALAESVASPESVTPPPESPTPNPVIEAQAVIAAAGDDMPQLQTLALRAGIEASPRWRADRLKQEIQAAVSRNLADGKPAFSG